MMTDIMVDACGRKRPAYGDADAVHPLRRLNRMRGRSRNRAAHGFTLVEVIIVLVIVGIFSALAFHVMDLQISGTVAHNVESSYGVSDVKASGSERLSSVEPVSRRDGGTGDTVAVTFRTKAGKVVRGTVSSPTGSRDNVKLYIKGSDGRNVEYDRNLNKVPDRGRTPDYDYK